MTKVYPKISYVTPVYNQVEFIEQTILSVINQNYPDFEYIIVDGGSTDGTLDIIKKYERNLFKWISEPDTGMYNALNKGFKHTSGEIMGWINGDDVLLPGAFLNMGRLFHDLPNVSWIQGLNTFFDQEGKIINTHPPNKFSFLKFLLGDFKWIQQESTFWRRNLWEKAGGKVDDRLILAGDFELWFRFFQFSKLYNTNIPIGAWRRRDGQLSEKFMTEYLEEADQIIQAYGLPASFGRKMQVIKFVEKLQFHTKHIKFLKSENLEKVKIRLYGMNRVEINFSEIKNKFIL